MMNLINETQALSSHANGHIDSVLASNCDDLADKTELQIRNRFLELIARAQSVRSLTQASQLLVDQLAELSGCRYVALGLTTTGEVPLRLAVLNGVSKIDSKTDLVRSYERALDESVSSQDEDHPSTHSCINHLARLVDCDGAIGVPLEASGNLVGSLLFLGARDVLISTSTQHWISSCRVSCGPVLDLMQRLDVTPLKWIAQSARLAMKRVSVKLIVAILLLACGFIPVSFKIKCPLSLEPVVRRFISAPFEGTLETVLVQPGEIVTVDQNIAVMDGREIRLEIAALNAEKSRAEKERDIGMATSNVSASQLADLEVDRVLLELELLRAQQQRLRIISPLDGIVVSGDLKRVEGARIDMGQALFEIAPLDRMVAEIEIPEGEVSRARVGMEVSLQFDSYPDRVLKSEIHRILPRSETRQQDNVFVAEVLLDNSSDLLRPGMKGIARIDSGKRMLGWILFHKATDRLSMWLGW